MILPDEIAIKAFLSSLHLFNQLEDAELDFVAAQAKSIFMRQTQIIYDRGDLCNGLFLIFSGKVSVFHYHSEEPVEFSVLEKNDHFGEEILGNASAHRQTMAKVEQDTVLVKFSRSALELIVKKIPSLQKPLNLSWLSFLLKLKKPCSWLNKDETIHYIARKHIYFLINALVFPIFLGTILLFPLGYLFLAVLPRNIPILVLGILSLVVMLFWSAWKGWDWTNDYIIITNQRIINLEKVSLFYESRQETPLEAIQSIETRSDQLGRWMSYGDIALRTFTGLIELNHLEEPEWIISLIQEYWNRAKTSQASSAKEDIEEDIRNRFINKSGMQAPSAHSLPVNHIPAEIESGRLTSTLSSFFKLREESGDTLIYRTHWWILVRKTWMPLLLLITLFAYLVAGASGSLGEWDIYSFFAIALIAGLILWIWLIYQYVDWRNDVYMITPDQIVDINRKPLGKEEKRTAPLKNIQTIEYKRLGLIGLMLNFGTVFIRVGDTEFTFDYVDDPSRVQKELFERFMRLNKREKEIEIQAERGRIADYLDAYHNIVKDPQQSTSNPKTDEFD